MRNFFVKNLLVNQKKYIKVILSNIIKENYCAYIVSLHKFLKFSTIIICVCIHISFLQKSKSKQASKSK